MMIGILSGFTAAFFNSAAFLFSFRFLMRHNSPVRLLISAQIVMMIISLPFLIWIFPFQRFFDYKSFIPSLIFWLIVFFAGQGSFFAALRYFEASRLSSLLGLKIIVMTVIFMLMKHHYPSLWQWLAVIITCSAAIMINWTGNCRMVWNGWIFVFITLSMLLPIGYL